MPSLERIRFQIGTSCRVQREVDPRLRPIVQDSRRVRLASSETQKKTPGVSPAFAYVFSSTEMLVSDLESHR